ncbi:hypothetical protein GCM10012280_16650 [Wenjunlia tyrosinilytica]|uniref:Uncharacterized protein n=1 Tax=Wenjunlia tyrosinilytica TaxID=1544741 RepID=A0A917ZJP0_9ACTN|nr:hypothetical protein GCM10012280_16650 [Wenjunlia tyrosinilytica]
MTDFIARFVDGVRAAFGPRTPGRRRARGGLPVPGCLPCPPPRARQAPRTPVEPLDGEAHDLVRPYLLDREEWRRRRRRRTLLVTAALDLAALDLAALDLAALDLAAPR